MKFKVQKSSLLEGFNLTQNIVGTRQSIPILANALVVAENNALTIMTTDLDITIIKKIEAACPENGRTTIPAKKFSAILHELPEGELEIVVDDKQYAHINSGAAQYKMVCRSADDFPDPPTSEGSITFTMKRQMLVNMLNLTSYAVSTDDSRRVLMGVFFEFNSGKLTCVATDGRRLALIDTEVEFPAENARSFIVPSRAVAELVRIIGNTEGDVKIHVKGGQSALFEMDDTTMSCKLIEGAYPNYRQVMPNQCENRLSIPREELDNALRRTMIFTSDKTNSMRISVHDNLLTITAHSPDIGEAVEKLAVKYNGPKIEATYNPQFMKEPIHNLKSDEVFLELNDSISPGLIKCDIPFVYVLMPLRV